MTDVDSVLESLQRSALALRAESPTPAGWLRVSAGDVTVELSWPGPTGDQPGGGTLVAAAVAPARPASVPPAALPAQPAPVENAPVEVDLSYITSPTVGTYYGAPKPGAKPFVREGDLVVRGQQVAIIEVMKLMIPVEAPSAGRVVEVLQTEAGGVEYGAPLFAMESAG